MSLAYSPASLHEHAIDGDAQHHAIECLVNCYLREYALPRGEASLNTLDQDLPMSLRQVCGQRVCIRLSAGRLALLADRTSVLGRCRFISAPFFKGKGHGWRPLGALELAHLLLAPLTSAERYCELIEQFSNSLDVTRTFLLHAVSARGQPEDSLLRSEQHQVWGHALHPTPKSREGVSLDALLACSPEVGASFALHWFRVDPSLVRLKGSENVRETLFQLSGRSDLYPCHPWEVQRILANPLVQQAQARGHMKYLGAQGLALYPTSSVRTLYHPDLRYFLKCSVHVRLTNCVRKNAWYELDSAVALTRLLTPIMDELAEVRPGFELMPEPAASTLDLTALGDIDAAREVKECFGILYRRNLDAACRATLKPQVAMALFTWDLHGQSACLQQVRQCAERLGLSVADATLLWLERYSELLLGGVLHCLFRHGVVLEPHLQNTLIGFDENCLPCHVWVRDLEGTKLVPGYWPQARLEHLDDRTLASLYYSADKAWKRFAYCTLVNNLGEAIFHLADGQTVLEKRLWQRIGKQLDGHCLEFDQPQALRDLCAGGALPSKENFMTRLMQRADRDAGYNTVPNPFTGPRA